MLSTIVDDTCISTFPPTVPVNLRSSSIVGSELGIFDKWFPQVQAVRLINRSNRPYNIHINSIKYYY